MEEAEKETDEAERLEEEAAFRWKLYAEAGRGVAAVAETGLRCCGSGFGCCE